MHWASVIFQIRGRYFQFLRDSKQKEHVPPPRMLLLVSQMPSTQMGQFARTSAKMARAAVVILSLAPPKAPPKEASKFLCAPASPAPAPASSPSHSWNRMAGTEALSVPFPFRIGE